MQKYYKFIKLSNKQEKNMRTLPIIVTSVSPITLASASPITVASASPLVCTNSFGQNDILIWAE